MKTYWAYLNVDDPLVAWLVYRGEMFSARMANFVDPKPPSALSIFHTSRLRRGGNWYDHERRAEQFRARHEPDSVSRLEGYFVFGDEEAAIRAAGRWDGSFRAEFLSEVGIDTSARVSRYDSDWITEDFETDPNSWASAYFKGEPRGDDPLWEFVVSGRGVVYGTDLRERAYETVRRTWPDSLAALEIGRLAAAVGSSVGRIVALPLQHDGGVWIRYAMDMVEANEPSLIERLAELRASGHPFNDADLAPLDDTVWFRAPDLRPQEFRIPNS